MADIDQLVEKFRSKLLAAQEAEKYKDEIIAPLVNSIFNDDFASVFQTLANEINTKLNFKIVSFQTEGKTRFILEGQYHRIYFQRGKIEIFEEIVNVNIIPIYIWKGVTKHLGPISFAVKPTTREIKWDIPFNSIQEYSEDLFSKLVDDEDFFM